MADLDNEKSPASAPSPPHVPALQSDSASVIYPKRSPADIETAKDTIASLAYKVSSQPLQNYDPHVWGVLTAISDNARKRPQVYTLKIERDKKKKKHEFLFTQFFFLFWCPICGCWRIANGEQGINLILTSDEHCIGRLVDDWRFQIESYSVSANHCVIFRKKVANGDEKESSNSKTVVFLKDTRLCIIILFFFVCVFFIIIFMWLLVILLAFCSTNGTYINWKRATKGSDEEVRHGDIISLAAPPQHGNSKWFFF